MPVWLQDLRPGAAGGLMTQPVSPAAARQDADHPARTVTISSEQRDLEEKLTRQVIAAFDGARSPRLRQLLTTLTRHMHDWVREVRLTDDEWKTVVKFLAAAGHMTDDRRNEFLLLGDMFGLPALVVMVNNPVLPGVTEATLLGPFFADGGPAADNGADVASGASGTPAWVEGTVCDTDGNPVAAATIYVWGSDADGLYDVQYNDGRVVGRAHLRTGDDGGYRFWTVKPVPYPVPSDGPVGTLLDATSRSPYRAAHLHLMVEAPGYRTLITNIFDADDQTPDTVFGHKASLRRVFEHCPPGTPAPGGRHIDGPWAKVRFDITLAPAPAPADPDAAVEPVYGP